MAEQITKPRPYPLRKHIRNLTMIIVGTLINVSGILVFIRPCGLPAGGVMGISILVNHVLPVLPLYLLVVLLNIPLLIWGWNKLKLRFALYTVFCIGLQSLLLGVLEGIIPTYSNNVMLGCIFGGVLMGFGCGIVVRYHGSGGGTDIVGIILKDKFDISVGNIALSINAVIVCIASFVYGLEPALYTIVELYVMSKVFTQVQEGLNRRRNMIIITDFGRQIAERLMFEMGRGVTFIQGEGGYTHVKKDVLFCVASRFELSGIKEIIHQCDPHAFVCVNETYEVMGAFANKNRINAIIAEARLAQEMAIQAAHDAEPEIEAHKAELDAKLEAQIEAQMEAQLQAENQQ